jgi:hypothetical protein
MTKGQGDEAAILARKQGLLITVIVEDPNDEN